MAEQNLNYRDFSVPFSDQELHDLRHVFESMPTYCSADFTVKTEDFAEILHRMKYERTDEQIQGYIDFWQKHNNGRMDIDDFLTISSVTHRTSVLSYVYARKLDRDQKGVITKDEFNDLLRLMSLHDPKLSGKTYADFTAEADSYKDGKVSLDECAAWIEAHCASRSIWELSKRPYIWPTFE